MLDACFATPVTGFPVSLMFPDVEPQVLAQEEASERRRERLALARQHGEPPRRRGEI